MWDLCENLQRVTQQVYNLTLNEAVDLAENRPVWRLMSAYGAMHS